MLDHHSADTVQLVRTEATRRCELNRIEPEFSRPLVPFNVDVRRLDRFEAVEAGSG
jgi:hypothetical protein